MAVTAFHGIGAFRGQRNPIALSRQLTMTLSGVTICAAERPIGAFGAVVTGRCLAAWPYDVWSETDEKGVRTAWDAPKAPIGDDVTDNGQDIEQREWERLLTDPNCEHADHAEAWIECYGTPSLRAIWIKAWAPDRTKKAAKIIARHRRVPLLNVDRDTNIDSVWHNLRPMQWAA